MAKRPTKLTDEDFSAWKDNPTTMVVFSHMRNLQGEIEESWLGLLKGQGGIPDSDVIRCLLVEFRSKHAIIDDLIALDFHDIQGGGDGG